MSRSMFAVLALALGSLVTWGAGETLAQHGHNHGRYSYRTQPRFGARSHLDALSADLQHRANAICWEMYNNYQRNPGWRETYGEAYEILQSSKHIRELIHAAEVHGARNELGHIAEDLAEIDQLFHHIEDDIAHWRPSRVHPHHHHHVHADLGTLVEEYEETLHHLMEDYGVRSQIAGPAPAPGGGNAPPPPGFRP